jgi:hypothetical protein
MFLFSLINLKKFISLLVEVVELVVDIVLVSDIIVLMSNIVVVVSDVVVVVTTKMNFVCCDKRTKVRNVMRSET